MRVLHIDSGREMRGGQRQALSLMEGLRASGHESVLLSPPRSPLAVRASADGFEVRELSITSVSRNAAAIDLLHAHDARAHTLGLTVCRVPLAVARRVAFPVQRGPASRWKYSRADHFIAISQFVRSRLKEVGVPDDKISVVYDGVAIPPHPASGELIVAPSTGDPRKGVGLAREAGFLAGVDVRFSTDLESDLRRARLFLYLSDQEGLGSAALLASAYGVPVIASAVGGLCEAVEDGRTGLLTENRPDAVAACIQRLLREPALALEMGARGRERISAQFTVSAMVDGTLKVYERLLG